MFRDLLSDLRFRLRAAFRRADVERELSDELQFHVEIETDRLVGEGLPAHEALRQARLSLGGVEQVKEATRDARGLAWMDALSQDLRYAARGLRRSPGFTGAVVATFALGLGVNVALFTVIDRLVLRSPAYLVEPSRVHRVAQYSSFLGRRDTPIQGMSHERFLNIAHATHSFDRIASVGTALDDIGIGTDVHEGANAIVTGGYFDFFDARPIQGRFITVADDSEPDGAPVVVISYTFWRERFGARGDAVGATLQVDKVTRTIIGVAPEGFVGITNGSRPPEIWTPAGVHTRGPMLVRRRPGVSVATASADLTAAFVRSYEAERMVAPRALPLPVDVARPSAAVISLHPMLQPNAPPEAKLLPWLGAVGLIVLVIACANVANLLLARALRRRREIAVRLALGVSRIRLFRQFLTEILVLALLGGGVGLLAARWGALALRTLVAPLSGDLTDVAVLSDSRTMLFASSAALGVGLVAGLAPIVQVLGQDLAGSLKSGVGEGSSQRSRTRDALLVSQIALCAALLVGAGLFIRSLGNVGALRLGYDVDPILNVSLDARGTTLSDSTRRLVLLRMAAEVTTIPGVTRVARGAAVPGSTSTEYQPLSVPGIAATEGRFFLDAAAPEYFATVGTRILRGRAIDATDGPNAPLVAVVSETMGHALWPRQDAIGRCIRVGRGLAGVTPTRVYIDPDTAPCRTVVGVAEDIKQSSFVDDPGLQYYLPIDQYGSDEAYDNLTVRVAGNASQFAEPVRRRLQSLVAAYGRVTVAPLRDALAPQMRPWRLGATLFLGSGALALLVAALGLFAVISYHVEQRRHELGVRIALGAEVDDILRIVVGPALRFAAIGLGLGATIAVAAGRWVAPLLFRESPADPVIYATVGGVLAVVALAASALPALRAARTDPNLVLRSE